MQTDRDLSSADLLPKCSQELGLSQPKAWIHELPSISSTWEAGTELPMPPPAVSQDARYEEAGAEAE